MFVFFSKKKNKSKSRFQKKAFDCPWKYQKKNYIKNKQKKTTDNVSTLYFEIKKQN